MGLCLHRSILLLVAASAFRQPLSGLAAARFSMRVLHGLIDVAYLNVRILRRLDASYFPPLLILLTNCSLLLLRVIELMCEGGLRVQVLIVKDLFLGLVDLVAGEAPLHCEEHVALAVDWGLGQVTAVEGRCRVFLEQSSLLVAAEKGSDLGHLTLVLHR